MRVVSLRYGTGRFYGLGELKDSGGVHTSCGTLRHVTLRHGTLFSETGMLVSKITQCRVTQKAANEQ